jgi:hypothetical protein
MASRFSRRSRSGPAPAGEHRVPSSGPAGRDRRAALARWPSLPLVRRTRAAYAESDDTPPRTKHAAVVAFNVAMMVVWSAAGPSRDALVVAGWISGDAVLCLIPLFVTDR